MWTVVAGNEHPSLKVRRAIRGQHPTHATTRRWRCSRLAVVAKVVLRVRLIAGDRLDVTYEEPQTTDADAVAEQAIAVLADAHGVLRARHGDRLVVLYGRGVAALEIAPRGAVL